MVNNSVFDALQIRADILYRAYVLMAQSGSDAPEADKSLYTAAFAGLVGSGLAYDVVASRHGTDLFMQVNGRQYACDANSVSALLSDAMDDYYRLRRPVPDIPAGHDVAEPPARVPAKAPAREAFPETAGIEDVPPQAESPQTEPVQAGTAPSESRNPESEPADDPQPGPSSKLSEAKDIPGTGAVGIREAPASEPAPVSAAESISAFIAEAVPVSAAESDSGTQAEPAGEAGSAETISGEDAHAQTEPAVQTEPAGQAEPAGQPGLSSPDIVIADETHADREEPAGETRPEHEPARTEAPVLGFRKRTPVREAAASAPEAPAANAERERRTSPFGKFFRIGHAQAKEQEPEPEPRGLFVKRQANAAAENVAQSQEEPAKEGQAPASPATVKDAAQDTATESIRPRAGELPAQVSGEDKPAEAHEDAAADVSGAADEIQEIDAEEDPVQDGGVQSLDAIVDKGSLYQEIHKIGFYPKLADQEPIDTAEIIIWPIRILDQFSGERFADILVAARDSDGNEYHAVTEASTPKLTFDLKGFKIEVYSIWRMTDLVTSIASCNPAISVKELDGSPVKYIPEGKVTDAFLDQFRKKGSNHAMHFIVPYFRENRGEKNIPISGCIQIGQRIIALKRYEYNALRYSYRKQTYIITGHWEGSQFKIEIES